MGQQKQQAHRNTAHYSPILLISKLTLKLWVKKEMVSRTVRHTSVAILPSSNAWCTISASEVPAPADRKKKNQEETVFSTPAPTRCKYWYRLVLPLHFPGVVRWGAHSKMLNLPAPFRECLSLMPTKKKKSVFPLNPSLKPDADWGVQVSPTEGKWKITTWKGLEQIPAQVSV